MNTDSLDAMAQRADEAMVNAAWQMILGQFHATGRRP